MLAIVFTVAVLVIYPIDAQSSCKGVVFALEATEVTGKYITTFLDTVLNLVDQFHASDPTSVYRLVLYSLDAYEPFPTTNDFQQFKNMTTLLKAAIFSTQFINGFDYLDKGANKVVQMIQREPANFKAATVFMGQTRFFDCSSTDITNSAALLHRYSRDTFAVDGPESAGINPWIWPAFTQSGDRILAMSSGQTAASIAALIGPKMVPIVQGYAC